jgi:hypothetical protein
MEFKFTAEHEALRKEVRDFLAEALPNRGVGPVRPTSQENWEEQLAFNKKLAKKGWIAPAWPKEYGGLGWSHIKQMIFSEELAYAGAPDGGRGFNVGMIGPTLIVHGTPEQKPNTSPASPTPKSPGARATPNPAPAPTSPPSRPAPSATVTTTSSTARRSGPPAPTTPTGASSSSAPTPTRRSTRASPSSSST